MKMKKGRMGFVTSKIDLEKTYGRLRWDFIVDVIKEINVPKNLCKIIMECVTSSSMNMP